MKVFKKGVTCIVVSSADGKTNQLIGKLFTIKEVRGYGPYPISAVGVSDGLEMIFEPKELSTCIEVDNV